MDTVLVWEQYDACIMFMWLGVFHCFYMSCIGLMSLPGGLPPLHKLANLNVTLPDLGTVSLPGIGGMSPAGNVNVFKM